MPQFTLYDMGEIIDASSEKELIDKLRTGSWYFASQTNSQYMKGYAERTKLLTGKILNPNSENEFVKSLIDNNLLRKGADPSVIKSFRNKK